MKRPSLRTKLLVCLSLLGLSVLVLFVNGLWWALSIGTLTTSVKDRTDELPLAAELSSRIGALQVSLARVRPGAGGPGLFVDRQLVRGEFDANLLQLRVALDRYQDRLGGAEGGSLADTDRERAIVDRLNRSLDRIEVESTSQDWVLDSLHVGALEQEIDALGAETASLPALLQDRVDRFADEVRGHQNRQLLNTVIWSSVAGLALVLALGYVWASVFGPLRTLIHDSRKIAGGDFHHRACVGMTGEMGELAAALNAMTGRFVAIHDDLGHQVQQRTKEVVRQEKLASVGFLAAGVAHEINNPLAAIAWSAESLEARLVRLLEDAADGPGSDEGAATITLDPALTATMRKKLHTIQEEAFRAKGITERLLDYSRMGDVKRSPADLTELVTGVVDLIRDLGKYRGKRLVWEPAGRHVASVSAQEIKQVVLNLLTNALDCVDVGGTVTITVGAAADPAPAGPTSASLTPGPGSVVLSVVDDGCGMTEEVLSHLFEPFYTRRRDNSGTGLGLSISSRIVYDHGGRIEPSSAGPGQGSTFRVYLPKATDESQTAARQAA